MSLPGKAISDSAGPVIFYHGTRREFEVFDLKYWATATDPGKWGAGFYFCRNRSVARRWAGPSGRIIEAILAICHPAHPDEAVELVCQLPNGLAVRKELIRQGFDGVWAEGYQVALALHPEQIIRLSEVTV